MREETVFIVPNTTLNKITTPTPANLSFLGDSDGDIGEKFIFMLKSNGLKKLNLSPKAI